MGIPVFPIPIYSDDGYFSWGRLTRSTRRIVEPRWSNEAIDIFKQHILEEVAGDANILPYGLGRSYGDSCLNEGGLSISSRNLNHFIHWDPTSGILRCEGGLSLFDLIRFSVPRGWFLPVSPGTQYVTIGGAIANDVHGKNHHKAGTFGCFVRELQLLRSDGIVYHCSPGTNTELFNATIGGLGLTGMILSADVQLVRIPSAWIQVEETQFRSLDEFFDISRGSADSFDYTVAWLDCVSGGTSFGRGIFMRGNFAAADQLTGKKRVFRFAPGPKVAVPLVMPGMLLNRYSMQLFNSMYFHKQRSPVVQKYSPLTSFFYPLDSVGGWNKLYGGKGFYQFQCVLPTAHAKTLLQQILKRVVESGNASFLAVLKEFGSIASPGILSFPRAGVTLCMDFAHRGTRTLQFLEELEGVVRDGGGALYPAKDAVMSAQTFRKSFERLPLFHPHRDPRFSSSFWRRVQGQG